MSVASIPARGSRVDTAALRERLGVLPVLIALIVVMSVIAPNFLTVDNFFEVARQVSVNAILALGVTFVILTAGIDLSVGSLLGLSALIALLAAKAGLPTPVCLLGALAVGVAGGLLNGLLVARLALASFIVTLAALTIFRGLVFIGTDGSAVTPASVPFAWIGQGSVGSVPVAVIVMVAVFAGAWLLLNRTVFGLRVLAVGGNAEAARLAGIPVKRTLTIVYVLSGLCAGIAGIILAARLQSAVPDLGTGYELNAIAAVVLGGTSLAGGRGSLAGTLVGAMIIGVLGNGLVLMNVPSFWQLLIQGLVILVAVVIDRVRS
jgi:ribose transport system permease protein